MKPYTKIALTGGPNGGKSTCLVRIMEHLQNRGHKVYVIPEAATILFQLGIEVKTIGNQAFQEEIIKTINILENVAAREAEVHFQRTGKKSVIICDRGIMDGAAYLGIGKFSELLAAQGLHHTTEKDVRYDAVIHLVTSPKEFYSKATNPNRQEDTHEQAVIACDCIRNVWVGHPHFRIIDNSTDFETKVKRTIEAVCNAIGDPIPMETERKFLLLPDFLPLVLEKNGIHYETSLIVQHYLLSENGDTERVRERIVRGRSVYTHTVKGQEVEEGKRPENERVISHDEFFYLLKKKDPNRRPIFKNRFCFVYENQHLELDAYITPHAGLSILEIEVESLKQAVILPPFLKVVKEVTNDKRYSNKSLAKGIPIEN